jgi:hypothetical protein
VSPFCSGSERPVRFLGCGWAARHCESFKEN